jgi:hypothetical protein
MFFTSSCITRFQHCLNGSESSAIHQYLFPDCAQAFQYQLSAFCEAGVHLQREARPDSTRSFGIDAQTERLDIMY